MPRSEGLFPSQPGRSRRDERRGFGASRRYLAGLKPPKASAATARVAGRLPARGGSLHYAFRGPGNRAFLFNGPQVGFSIPELFVELEVHAPGLDVRGVTAPGIPVIAIGHNGRDRVGHHQRPRRRGRPVRRAAARAASATASRAARAG